MLIHTKMQRPRLQQDAVQRPDLIARLNRGLDRKLTLISAQAGAGKTTLMAQWLGQCSQPSAWLSLDVHDNDLMMFGNYVCAAIRTVFHETCGQALDLLQTHYTPPRRLLVATLVNELDTYFAQRQITGAERAQSPSLILALDDFHTITAPAVLAFITELIAYLPKHLHVAITSRTDPPLPLVALRARKEMRELRTSDLRFTTPEAQVLLESTVGRPLSHETVVQLGEATDGWAVGLRLAALSLRNVAQVDDFAFRFRETGSAAIVDYLTIEVLEQQRPAVRKFLLATSVLERFNADLCAALFQHEDARPGPDNAITEAASDSMLQEIIQANLFLLPLDAEGRWFRYHHLFRDFLRHLLQREGTPEESSRYHHRAARWFEQHGLIDEALNHAFAAGDTEQAAQIVAGQRHALMNRAAWQRLERYLHRFAPQVIDQRPDLLMLKTWLLYHNGRTDQLPAALRQVEAALARADMPSTAARHLRGEISALASLIAYYQTDPARTTIEAEFALANTPAELWIVRILARLFLGGAYQMQGDARRAETTILHGSQEETVNSHSFTATMLLSACYVYWVTGELERLRQTAQRCIDYCDYPSSAEIEGYARYQLGRAYYQWNNLAAAEEQFGAVVQQPYLNYGDAYANAAYGFALTYQAQKREAEARAVVEEAVEFMAERGNTTLLALAQAAQADVALRQGDYTAAAKWADLYHDLPPFAPMPHLIRPHLTLAKVWLTQDTPDGRQRAAVFLDQLQAYAERTHSTSVLIEALTLQTLRQAAAGEPRHLQPLARALTLARPGGYIRLFVDLGAPMAALLRMPQPRHPDAAYIARILAAFPTQDSDGNDYLAGNGHPPGNYAPDASGLAEPLTPREMDVLTLLARRLSNREIAAKLVVSAGTVKTHTLNIYAKLDVHSRTQAVKKAKELGLLTSG